LRNVGSEIFEIKVTEIFDHFKEFILVLFFEGHFMPLVQVGGKIRHL